MLFTYLNYVLKVTVRFSIFPKTCNKLDFYTLARNISSNRMSLMDFSRANSFSLGLQLGIFACSVKGESTHLRRCAVPSSGACSCWRSSGRLLICLEILSGNVTSMFGHNNESRASNCDTQVLVLR